MLAALRLPPADLALISLRPVGGQPWELPQWAKAVALCRTPRTDRELLALSGADQPLTMRQATGGLLIECRNDDAESTLRGFATSPDPGCA